MWQDLFDWIKSNYPYLEPFMIVIILYFSFRINYLQKEQKETWQQKLDYLEKYYFRPDTIEQIQYWQKYGEQIKETKDHEIEALKNEIQEIKQSSAELDENQKAKISELEERLKSETRKYDDYVTVYSNFSGSVPSFTKDFNNFLSSDTLLLGFNSEVSAGDAVPVDPQLQIPMYMGQPKGVINLSEIEKARKKNIGKK
jgi:Zn-dependent oligopeptidase